MKTKILTYALLILSLASCRSLIMEERSECPAWIQVKADRMVDEQLWPYFSFRMMNPDADWLQRQVAQTGTFCTEGVSFAWTKNSSLEVTCVSNWSETLSNKENSLLIPLTQECPESLAGCAQAQTEDAEQYVVEIPLQSLFATFYFEVEILEKDIPLQLQVSGDVDGYSLPHLLLHEGPYRAQAREIGPLSYAVRIPRQATPSGATIYAGSLLLDLLTQDDDTGEWVAFQRLPLGEMATLRGYDWSQSILNDCHIHLTLEGRVLVNYSIQVQEWETEVVHLNHWNHSI